MVDWDKVVKEADESPRAVLAKWLAEADDLTAVVVIGEKHYTGPDAVENSRIVNYESSGLATTTLGLMIYALDAHRAWIQKDE